MKTAVIFGVSGQDGGFLSRLLLEKNYRVVGVARQIQKNATGGLNRLGLLGNLDLVSGSVADLNRVVQVIGDHAPCEVYNLAGQTSVARSFDQPYGTFEGVATGTLNILEAIRRSQTPTKFFNAGSGECFGNHQGDPFTEETPFNPASPYGAAKAAAHHLVRVYRDAYDLFACTGILFNHESYLRPAGFVTRKIVKTACEIARGECAELALGNISIERDWGWAPEYVEAMWMMLQQEKPDDFLLATGTTMSLEAFIAAVFDRLDLDWKAYVKIDPQFYRPADIQSVRTNPGKARDKLNWKARFTALDVAHMMVDAELENRS